MLASVEIGDEEQDREEDDPEPCVGSEQAVRPTGAPGESVDPAVEAAVHSVRSSCVIGAVDGASRARIRRSAGQASTSASAGTRRAAYRSASATTTTSSSGPITGKNSGMRSIGEITHDGCDCDSDLHPPRYPGIAAKSASGRDARRQHGREVLGETGREPLGEQDHHRPRRGDDDHRDDQPAKPHVLPHCNVCYMSSQVRPYGCLDRVDRACTVRAFSSPCRGVARAPPGRSCAARSRQLGFARRPSVRRVRRQDGGPGRRARG